MLPCSVKRVLAVSFLALLAGAVPADDANKTPRPDPNGLPMVLERIRGHAAKDDWKAEGWSDATIEKWLDAAVAKVAIAVEKPELKSPLKFADVRPVAAARGAGFLRGGGLIVATNVEVAHAHDLIVLADGSVDISHAHNCVVVARGVASLSHCHNCLVVSGTLVEVAGDERSIVLCRGRVDIAHAHGTVVLGHEGVTISHAHGVTFLGSDGTTSHRDGNSKVVKLPASFPVEPRSAHALEKKLQVLGAVRPKGLVLRFEGKRYVADLNAPIVDEGGAKVAGLDGWRVTFVGDEAAVLSDGETDVPVGLPQK